MVDSGFVVFLAGGNVSRKRRRTVKMERTACKLVEDGVKDRTLLKSGSFIAGVFVDREKGSGRSDIFEVRNPANGDLVGEVLEAGASETEEALRAAYTAWELWKAVPCKERAERLRRWYELIIENRDDLGWIMTIEQGKALVEAKSEVTYAASFVDWFSGEAVRIHGDFVNSGPTGRALMIRQPVGVCAAITPWNFPAAMMTRKAAAALAAGCTMVVKPSELTPLTALALAELARRAEIPPGVLNVVCGTRAAEIGKVFTTSSLVRKITFTGSTRVGKLLMEQAASTVKRMSMELGGHAPFIVMKDADLDWAAKALILNKFKNNGQTCIAANRIYVQRQVYEAFIEKVKTNMEALKVGNGWDAGVEVGPLINQAAVHKVERHVEDAMQRGANLHMGGKHLLHLGENFYAPTLLVNVDDGSLIAQEETFGPVAALFPFDTEQEVIERANETQYGLSSYVFTRSLDVGLRLSENLDYGMVGLNEGAISNAAMAFGGVKESGTGREGSKYGLDEYQEIKYICIGGN